MGCRNIMAKGLSMSTYSNVWENKSSPIKLRMKVKCEGPNLFFISVDVVKEVTYTKYHLFVTCSMHCKYHLAVWSLYHTSSSPLHCLSFELFKAGLLLSL